MGCLLALVAMVSPRLALALVWLFSARVSMAFDSVLVPFLGLLFLPWTTLLWTLAYTPVRAVSGFGWSLVLVAFLADIAARTSGEVTRRQRYS